jgi:hypothetical protein
VTAALAKAAVRPASLSSARIEVRRLSDGAEVVVAAPVEAAALTGWMTDAAGARHAVSLPAIGPGTFGGRVPAPVAGACWFDLSGGDGSPVRAGASVPWPSEYAASGPDGDALEDLARRLGGGEPADGAGSRNLSFLPALLALLLFLADRARSGLKREDRPVR